MRLIALIAIPFVAIAPIALAGWVKHIGQTEGSRSALAIGLPIIAACIAIAFFCDWISARRRSRQNTRR